MKEILRIIKYTSSLWKLYLVIVIGTVVVALLSQASPLLVKWVIDAITGAVNGVSIDQGRIALLVFLIFAADAGSTLANNVTGYYGDMLAVRMQKLLAERYYRHLLTLSQKYFDSELTGTIINRLNRGVQEISDFANMFANNFFQFLLSTTFTLVIVAYYSWQVAIMLGVLYPVYLWLTKRTTVDYDIEQQKINKNSDIYSGRFAEAVGQIRVVKSFRREAHELKTMQGRLNNIIRARRRQSKVWHRQDVYRGLVLNVFFFVVYGYIIWQTARGNLTIGEMVLLIQYAIFIRIPIFSMSWLVENTQKAISNSRDYFIAMDIKPEIVDQPGAKPLNVSVGRLEYRDVSFGYDGKGNVLKKIDFAAKPNSRIALIGESGEGKTTIAHLLLRLYEPLGGQILIDGQDINGVTIESLRAQVGVVFQDSSLFSGTVGENILYGNVKASSRQVVAAAKAANAHEFISKFPKGYDSEIGERGIKLSGGQKQRIAIARALLKDPPILILDEATSSLDSKAELEVQTALERLMRGRTTLIIAHRLSTIKDADQIIAIKSGRVVESGSPSQLVKAGGIYAELLRLQTSSVLTRKKRLKEYDLVTS